MTGPDRDLRDRIADWLTRQAAAGRSFMRVDSGREDCPCVGWLDVDEVADAVAALLAAVPVDGVDGPVFRLRAPDEIPVGEVATDLGRPSGDLPTGPSPAERARLVARVLSAARQAFVVDAQRHQFLATAMRGLGHAELDTTNVVAALHRLDVVDLERILAQIETYGRALHRMGARP